MRKINQLVIHCADTPTGRPVTVADIDKWHSERVPPFKRKEADRKAFNPDLKSIGYHFVIYIDGTVHTGRQVEEIGSHVQGMNSTSIGISLIGSGIYTTAQWQALADLITNLQQTYPGSKVLGHYQCPTGAAQGKICPMFDVTAWLSNGMAPLPANVA